jgi:1-acyl-sn-glycerol-3-phosphate acyltransferase
MSKRLTIDKWSLGYWLLKYPITKPIHDLYYRKIHIQNASKIPIGEPVILAPNHQNALMDALAFVIGLEFQSVFLARADIFSSRLAIKILTFLKILPIYRIRDGRANLQKNEEIFDITLDILHNRENPLCMFPEGNHGDKRRLRPLVKGVFRIALKAQEFYQAKSGVKIVPIGVDYKHYQKFRQTQLINIGDPIEVCEYWDDYTENPVLAMNKLRDRLADEMKKLMIHIETEDYYDLYMGLREIYNKTMCRKSGLHKSNLYDQLIADKKMIDALDKSLESDPDKIKELNKIYLEYKLLRDRLKLRDWVLTKKKYSITGNLFAIILSVFVLPLVFLGIFNNWPHFFIPPKMLKGIKDPQFHSTAKWGAGFVLLVIYYLILLILALVFIPFWWLKLLYILTLPATGIFALGYRNFVVKTWARIRYSFRIRRKDPDAMSCKEKHDQLLCMVDAIYDRFKV